MQRKYSQIAGASSKMLGNQVPMICCVQQQKGYQFPAEFLFSPLCDSVQFSGSSQRQSNDDSHPFYPDVCSAATVPSPSLVPSPFHWLCFLCQTSNHILVIQKTHNIHFAKINGHLQYHLLPMQLVIQLLHGDKFCDCQQPFGSAFIACVLMQSIWQNVALLSALFLFGFFYLSCVRPLSHRCTYPCEGLSSPTWDAQECQVSACRQSYSCLLECSDFMDTAAAPNLSGCMSLNTVCVRYMRMHPCE